MDRPRGVERRQSAEDLGGDADRFVDGKRGPIGDQRRQRRPLHQLHHEVQDAVVLAGVVDVDEIVVVYRCAGAGLTQETLATAGICRPGGDVVQQFDSDVAVQLTIRPPVHRRSATPRRWHGGVRIDG
jgi:hypothetical protein